eukprot:SAG31_NODE_4546_length_3149_cov_2.210164_2_plen_75_part_00
MNEQPGSSQHTFLSHCSDTGCEHLGHPGGLSPAFRTRRPNSIAKFGKQKSKMKKETSTIIQRNGTTEDKKLKAG